MKHLGTTIPDVEEDQVFPTKRKAQQNSVEEEQALPIKRKAQQNNVEVSWPSLEQFSLNHPPKKASQCSPTVAPSILSNMDAGKLGPPSPTDLTWSDSSTCAPEATPALETTMNHQLENYFESGLPSSDGFQSCESTVIDDIFSRYIRSPSPEYSSPTADQAHEDVVDINDLVSPSNTSFSKTSLSHHPPEAPKETRQTLRIHLRVQPPEPKVMLRISMPKRKKSARNKRQGPQKTSTKRR